MQDEYRLDILMLISYDIINPYRKLMLMYIGLSEVLWMEQLYLMKSSERHDYRREPMEVR